MDGRGPPLEVIFSAPAIAEAVARLAAEIRRELRGHRIFAVPVMNGALYFAADLLRALGSAAGEAGADPPVLEGFGAASVASYGDGVRPAGPPRLAAFPDASRVTGRTVLLIDTVLDTGATLDVVHRESLARGAAHVRAVCLLEKPAGRRFSTCARFTGLIAPQRFLVGYGLDAGGLHRTLPHVAALPE